MAIKIHHPNQKLQRVKGRVINNYTQITDVNIETIPRHTRMYDNPVHTDLDVRCVTTYHNVSLPLNIIVARSLWANFSLAIKSKSQTYLVL